MSAPAVALTKKDENRVVQTIQDRVGHDFKKRIDSLGTRIKGYENLERKFESIKSNGVEPDVARAMKCARMYIDPETNLQRRLPDQLSPLCALVYGKVVMDVPAVDLFDPVTNNFTGTAQYSQIIVLPGLKRGVLVATDLAHSSTTDAVQFYAQESPSVSTSNGPLPFVASPAAIDNGRWMFPSRNNFGDPIYAVKASFTNSGTESLSFGLRGGYGIQISIAIGGVWVQMAAKYAIAGTATNGIVAYTGAEFYTAGVSGLFNFLAIRVLTPDGVLTDVAEAVGPVVSFMRPVGGLSLSWDSQTPNTFVAYTPP